MSVMTTYIDYEEDMTLSQEGGERIPFDLDYSTRLPRVVLPNKTLNIALAGTGVGKESFSCVILLVLVLLQGKNVLVYHTGDG